MGQGPARQDAERRPQFKGKQSRVRRELFEAGAGFVYRVNRGVVSFYYNTTTRTFNSYIILNSDDLVRAAASQDLFDVGGAISVLDARADYPRHLSPRFW